MAALVRVWVWVSLFRLPLGATMTVIVGCMLDLVAFIVLPILPHTVVLVIVLVIVVLLLLLLLLPRVHSEGGGGKTVGRPMGLGTSVLLRYE